MDDKAHAIDAARDAFRQHDWALARAHFTEIRESLDTDDLYTLAEADWWLGLVQEALAAYEETYQRYLREDRPGRAAISALDMATSLFLRGDTAVGSGWLSRFHRLLRDLPEGV